MITDKDREEAEKLFPTNKEVPIITRLKNGEFQAAFLVGCERRNRETMQLLSFIGRNGYVPTNTGKFWNTEGFIVKREGLYEEFLKVYKEVVQ